MAEHASLREYVPETCQELLDKSATELRSAIPELARDTGRMSDVEQAVKSLPSHHELHRRDARDLDFIDDESVHLAVTSPPYFNLKDYDTESDSDEQLGDIDDYARFNEQVDAVWRQVYDKLVPGGRMVVVVGDVLRSRSEHGRHRVVPLHATIQEHCTDIGFDNLAPIIWYKIGNASLEAGSNARFLGKPYEPGAVIKNDIEYILLFRKPGLPVARCRGEDSERHRGRPTPDDVPPAVGRHYRRATDRPPRALPCRTGRTPRSDVLVRR
jgi:hypothetical protein